MNPIDDFDALLTNGQGNMPEDASMASLLEARDRLIPLAAAQPSHDFAESLHIRLLERAAQLARAQAAKHEGMLGEEAFDKEATVQLPKIPAPRNPGQRGRITQRDAPRWVAWRSVAVVLVFMLFSIGLFSAIAGVRPGSPLYELQRWGQGVRVNLTNDPVSRARLHLQYASQALDLFDQLVSQHGDAASLDDALATLRSEMQAASAQIDALQSTATRSDLEQQLQNLQGSTRSDLGAALPQLTWPERIEATQVLGGTGDVVPTIARATVMYDDDQGWQITLQGAHFAQGAVALIDGQPDGAVTAVTATQLVAHLASNSPQLPPHVVGIGNPDDTAAQANATVISPDATATPTPQPTPAPEPSPTATGQGSSLTDLHGKIVSIDQSAGSFTISLHSGSTQTIVVNAQTQYTGSASSLSALKAGMIATVKGSYQGDGTFLATLVNTSKDDD